MAIGKWGTLAGALICAATLVACAVKGPSDPMARRLVGRWSQVLTFNDVRDEIAIDLRRDSSMHVQVKRHSGTGIDEYSGAGNNQLALGADIGGHDRQSSAHRFEARQRNSLSARRQEEYVGCSQQRFESLGTH